MSTTRAPRPVLVVGSRDSGKTAYVRGLAERARRAGLRVAGYCSEAEIAEGRKARYQLRDLARDAGEPGATRLLADREPGPGLDQRIGPFHLSGQAFAAAEVGLRAAAAAGADLIVLDEVGPLELRGGGFARALDALLAEYRGVLVLTARPSVVAPLIGRLSAAAGEGLAGRSGSAIFHATQIAGTHEVIDEGHDRGRRDHRSGERGRPASGRVPLRE